MRELIRSHSETFSIPHWQIYVGEFAHDKKSQRVMEFTHGVRDLLGFDSMAYPMTAPTVSRDASGRLAVEVFDIPLELYPSLCHEIALAFQLAQVRDPITNGVDVVVMDFRSELGDVEMAWDNWSGFIVTAKIRESEPLVQRIYEWCIDRKLGS